MTADLTCPTCEETQCVPPDAAVLGADAGLDAAEMEAFGCWDCRDGRRRPTLDEFDALETERDRYWDALERIAGCTDVFGSVAMTMARIARAALDGETR